MPTDKQRVYLAELKRRRDTLDPKQQAIVDELDRRWTQPTTPGQLSATADLPGKLRSAAGFAADVAAPALGAIGGGMAGAPGGPPGMITGATLGAGGMEAAHQLLKRGAEKIGVAPLTPPPSSPMEAAQDIGMAAFSGPLDVAGPVLKSTAGAALKASKTGIPEIAAEFDVPVTKAQQTQEWLPSAVENVTRKTLLGTHVFNVYDRAVNSRLVAAGQRIGRQMSGTKLDDYEAGELVKRSLDAADDEIGKQYGAVVDEIIAEAGSTPLEVTGKLQQRAKGLLAELKRPTTFATGLRSVEGVNKAISILEDFANVEKVVSTGVLGPGGEEITKNVAKTLTFEDAKLLRTLLFKLKESGEMSIGKGALGQLNHALDTAMQEGLISAGNDDLAKAFRAASSRFRESKNIIENSTMQAVVKNDRPDKILDVLMRSPETAFKNFNILVKNEGTKQAVRASLWEKILAKSQKEEVQVSNALEGLLKKIGTPALNQIFTPSEVGKIKRFAKLSDTLALKPRLAEPVSAGGMGLMATMQATGLGASLVHSVLTWTPQGMVLAGAGFIGPGVMAKMLTRPGAVDVMTKALRAQRNSRVGKQLFARISAMAAREGAKDIRPQQSDFASQISVTNLPPPPQ